PGESGRHRDVGCNECNQPNPHFWHDGWHVPIWPAAGRRPRYLVPDVVQRPQRPGEPGTCALRPWIRALLDVEPDGPAGWRLLVERGPISSAGADDSENRGAAW